MFCPKCGAELDGSARFCGCCGAPVPAAEEPVPAAGEPDAQRVGRSIFLCSDGAYRWVYEVNLFRNPAIFLTVWKIFFCLFLVICALSTVHDALAWGREAVLRNVKPLIFVFLGMTALTALAYLVYAAIMGGTYCVMFEMDENGINHSQVPHQAAKAELLSVLTALASTNLTTAGIAMNAARTELYSAFSSVKRVKAYPRQNLIKVNGTLKHNQVYAEPEDFAFVETYIRGHCKNAAAR